ncbi:uncharacterized protein LOC135937007 [Cloeon dipterum]|uniref:uncharacterized protein LOC135937007 n=1 Tax=Cloeon dipterum TaxID=197152 RepID=UPI00322076F6
MPDFPKLTDLAMYGVEFAEIVDCALQKYGKTLQSLRVIGVKMPNLSFQRIFKSCPKLEGLYLEKVGVTDNSEPINFNKLRVLNLVKVSSPGPSKILTAPNLKTIELKVTGLDMRNLSQVLPPRNQNNLKSFYLTLRTSDIISEISEDDFIRIASFLKHLAAVSPRLTFLNFNIGCTSHNYYTYPSVVQHVNEQYSFYKEKGFNLDWLIDLDLVRILEAIGNARF